MADFTLVVGVDPTLSVGEMRKGISQAISEINANPPKIKVQFDDASIKAMQSQLKAAMSDPTTAGKTGSMAGVIAETKQAAQANREYASTEKTKNQAVKDSENTQKSIQRTLMSYNTAIVQGEKNLRNWSAAEKSKNASSREAYAALRGSVEAMRAARAAYDNGTGSLENLQAATANYHTTLKTSEAAIRANGDATKTLTERMGGLAEKFASWLTVSQVIMYAVRAVRQMVSASIELDSAMTQMQIVTKASSTEMEAFGNNAAEAAQRAASTITDLVDSATTFARLGYNMDDSTQLAEYTAMLQNVGDIDVSEAQNAITAIIKAYDIDADKIESVMDKLVETGNNFPISVSQIAEGMNNASSTLAASGNTFEQSVALLTAANTTIQNAAKSSTGLRTIAARIRNTKTELDDLGEVMTEASYEELVSTLTDAGVKLTTVNGEYRSTYDIMSDIAAKWSEMSSMEQAAMATALSGTRQQAVFYSIIEQFQEASGAMDAMASSAGALDNAYSTYLDSAQAHIDKFKASFQEFSSNLLSGGLINGVVGFGTALLNVLNTLQKFHILLPTIAASIMIIKGIRMAKSMAESTAMVTTLSSALITNKGATDQLVASIAALTLQQKQQIAANIEQAVASGTLTAEEAAQMTTTLGLAAADGALSIANHGLAASFKAVMASIPVWGWIALGISIVVEAVTVLTTNLKSADERAAELKQEFNDLQSSMQQTANNFQQLKSSADEVIPRFAELARGVNQYGQNISLTEDEYAEFLSLNNQIAEMFPELNMGMDANGNYMLALSLSSDTLTESLYKQLEAQRQLANQELAEKLPDLIDNVKEQEKAYNKEKDNLKKRKDNWQEAYDGLKDVYSQEAKDAAKDLYGNGWEEEFYRQADTFATGYVLNLQQAFDAAGHIDLWQSLLDKFTVIDDDGYEIINWWSLINSDEMKIALDTIDRNIASYDTKIEEAWNSLKPATMAWLQTDALYGDLDTSMQDVVQQAVGNLDFNALGLKTESQIQDYITSNILQPLQNASPEVQQALKDLYEIDTSDISLDEYKTQVDALVQTVADGLGESADEIKQQFGFDKIINDLIANKQKIIDSLTFEDDSLADQLVGSLSPDQVTKAIDYIKNYGISSWEELQTAFNNNTYEAVVDISIETEGLDAFNKAMSESASSTGLTNDSISALTSRYADLEGHETALSSLFEKTANGIHLNKEAVDELEKAYANQNKDELQNKLETLKDKYNDLTMEMDNCADASERVNLYEQRDKVLAEIQDTAILISQYDALTSSYNAWQNAQGATDDRDQYEKVAKGYEDIQKLIDQGWYNDEEVNTYLDTMLNASERTKDNYEDFQKLTKNIEGTSFSIADFFKYDDDNNLVTDGLFDFMDTVKKKLGDDYVQIAEDGSYAWDFTGEKIKDVADALGMSTEAVGILEKAFGDITENINLDSFIANLDGLSEGMSDRVKDLEQALGDAAKNYDLGSFNFGSFDTEDIENQITNIKQIIDENFRDEDGNIDLSVNGAEEAVTILASLVARKQELNQPTVMSVDTSSLSGDVAETVTQVQNLQSALNDLELSKTVGADTSDAQEKIREVASALDTLPDETKTTLNIDQSALDAITSEDVIVNGKIQLPEDAVSALQSSISSIDAPMLVKLGVDDSAIAGYNPGDKTQKVTYLLESKEVDSYDPKDHSRTVTYSLVETSDLKNFNPSNITRTVTYNIKTNGEVPKAQGTAHSQGTAFASGNWGAKESGVALGGEIGQELVVRNGKFFTIGDDGAEFFQYKSGDIIFNAEQTRQILLNGKIKNGKKRGVAYAEGTAFGGGSQARHRRSGGGSTSVSSRKSGSSGGGGGSGGNRGSGNSSSAKDNKDTIDWIEIKLDRIERQIKNLEVTANNTYETLSTRNKALGQEISKTSHEIDVQQQAYDRYIKEANSVGLNSSLANKVKNGTIDINEYSGDTADKIKEFQKWYEKALDCADAIKKLKVELQSLYETKFNNIANDYENQLSLIEHLTKSYDIGIDKIVAKGLIGSAEYLKAQKDAETQNINTLKKELSALTASYSDAMNNGKIKKNSEAWYKMQREINGVKEAIGEAELAVLELNNQINELNWEFFDFLEEQISRVTDEADFLIDLMSHSDLFEDSGQITDKGMATMGLHGMNYNVYMKQADDYGKKVAEINKQLKNDPTNRYLIDQKNEYIDAQQDAILAAQDERDAIVDLVEEGIEKELDALQDLIDKRKDALDSAKDQYDYQKKINEQTKELATLQKRMSAYQGDTSEENKATIQKLQLELAEAQENLEETEYEHMISEQKAMLDNLYSEYEMILNERLDNIDGLISEMTEVINGNQNDIYETLKETASDVGYAMSEEMTKIWTDTTNPVLSDYHSGFTTQLTTVTSALGNIESLIKSMQTKANNEAKTTVKNTTKTTAATKPKATSTAKKTTTTTTKKTTSGGDGKAKVGDKVSYDSGIYHAASDGTGATGSKYRGSKVYITKINNASWAKYPYHLSTGTKLGKGDLGWVKLSQISGYSKGGYVGDLKKITSKNGDNLVSINTLKKGEAVLTPEQAKMFSELVSSLPYLNALVDSAVSANKVKGLGSNGANIGEISINIPIERVENYNDFINQLQKDRQFEKFIRSMSVDLIAGKSSLAKHKYKWNN